MSHNPKRRAGIYRLKITLQGVRPPVWRRPEAHADILLADLHSVIQIAMGWTNSHLHQFKIHGIKFAEPAPAGLDIEPFADQDEGKTKLNQVAAPGRRFAYEYDFGDSWEHDVFVENELPAEPGAAYPRCVAGRRSCPPEDCGGVGGYKDFLLAISDPEHERHNELLEWVGGQFDPEALDLGAVNESLRPFQDAGVK